eukprot:scaffold24455_cov94-Skeletonema_dohrnii-CCMP3373.AAC.1
MFVYLCDGHTYNVLPASSQGGSPNYSVTILITYTAGSNAQRKAAAHDVDLTAPLADFFRICTDVLLGCMRLMVVRRMKTMQESACVWQRLN